MTKGSSAPVGSGYFAMTCRAGHGRIPAGSAGPQGGRQLRNRPALT